MALIAAALSSDSRGTDLVTQLAAQTVVPLLVDAVLQNVNNRQHLASLRRCFELLQACKRSEETDCTGAPLSVSHVCSVTESNSCLGAAKKLMAFIFEASGSSSAGVKEDLSDHAAQLLLSAIPMFRWDEILEKVWVHSVSRWIESSDAEFERIRHEQRVSLLFMTSLHKRILRLNPSEIADFVPLVTRGDSSLVHCLSVAAPLTTVGEESTPVLPHTRCV